MQSINLESSAFNSDQDILSSYRLNSKKNTDNSTNFNFGNTLNYTQ